MQPHDLTPEETPHETVVVAKHSHASSRFGRVREKFSSLSKNRYTQLGLILLLVLAVPITVLQSFKQQDVRQHADTKRFSDPKYIGSLPPFNSLTELESTLGAGHSNSPYKIQQSDYDKCPAAVTNQPGWWDPASKKNSNEGTDAVDPDWFFGNVLDGTDPVGDPFYTGESPVPDPSKISKPNAEARWAGNTRYPVASPHDRGIGYTYSEYFPGVMRVGGWSYEWDKDHACWGISTYECTLDKNKMPAGGGRNGWGRAMGWASNATRHYLDSKNVMPNRECILAIAVMETRVEWMRDIGEEDSFAHNVNASLRNPEATGFYLASSPASGATTGGDSSGLKDVITTPASDAASCSDKTSFADVTDKDLQTAISCLGTKAACTVRGFVEGNFGPNDILTRGQFYAFLARYHIYIAGDWKPVDPTTVAEGDLFTDVPRNYGTALEIYTAVKNGFTDVQGKSFQPNEKWTSDFTGFDFKNYNFDKLTPNASITRGDLIKKMYAAMSAADKTKACNGGGSAAAPSSGALKDPTPFTEVASDKDARTKVCGDKASLLAGHVTSEPSIRAFKDFLYVFAKGKNDELYVRKLTPSVTTDGTLTNLANSPWTDMGKQIAGDPVTYLQNEEGVPSLSVIVTLKGDTKASISSTTGTSWSAWNENKIGFNSQMQTLHFTSVNNLTFSFKMGDESSENNLCMSIAAVPVSGGVGSNPGKTGSQPGSTTPSVSPATPSSTATSPSPSQGETFASCKERVGTNGAEVCCRTNPAYANEIDCKQLANSSDIPTPTRPAPGSGLVTATPDTQNQNLAQQFWSWLTGLFK